MAHKNPLKILTSKEIRDRAVLRGDSLLKHQGDVNVADGGSPSITIVAKVFKS